MPRTLSSRLAVPAAMLAGGLIGLAFAPFKIWPAALLGVALLSWSLYRRTNGQALLLGLVAGLVMNTVTIGWISVLGWYVAVALIAFMSLWTMLLGWFITQVQRLRFWPVWAACGWVAVEVGASLVPFGGFGWVRLAYTTGDQPLSGFLPWVGVIGASWLVALVGGLLAQVAMEVRKGAIPAAIAVSVFLVGGLLKFVPYPYPSETVNAGIVQGDLVGVGHGNVGYARSVTNNHFSETINLMAKARAGLAKMPDFILWPENSTDIDPVNDPDTRRLVEMSAAIAERPILVGAVMDGPGPDERQITGLWWDPGAGPGPRYDKRNLVPFGEWIPFRDFLLPRMPILKQTGRQGIPGTKPGVLAVDVPGHKGLRIGDIICFELAYDNTVYDTVRNGAQVLTVQSNNGTYTATSQPYQQFEISRIRAMETRREILIATTNSLSGLVNPDGSVAIETNTEVAASRVVTVPLRTSVTPGVTLQPWLQAGLTLIALGALGLSIRKKRPPIGCDDQK